MIVDRLMRDGVTVDVLVNNAGFGALGPVAELEVHRQMEMIQVNVAALTHLTRLLLPKMIERRRGGILNVASTAGFQAGPFMAVYYATKAYVISFSEALADELAASGLTVTCLCPGPTVTEFAGTAKMGNALMFRLGPMTAAAGRADRLPQLSPRTSAGRGGVDQLPGHNGRSLDSPQHGAGNCQAFAMEQIGARVPAGVACLHAAVTDFAQAKSPTGRGQACLVDAGMLGYLSSSLLGIARRTQYAPQHAYPPTMSTWCPAALPSCSSFFGGRVKACHPSRPPASALTSSPRRCRWRRRGLSSTDRVWRRD